MFVLDDILQLKRRPTGANTVSSNDVTFSSSQQTLGPSIVDTGIFSSSVVHDEENAARTKKRRRVMSKGIHTPKEIRSISPAGNCVSEDEHSEPKHYIALDLTIPSDSADHEVLAGCSALLRLSSQTWM